MAPRKSIWPASVRSPARRLVVAFLVVPPLVTLVLVAGAFFLAGMTEPTLEAVVEVTVVAGTAILALTVGFTLTFGLAGVAILWLLGLAGWPAWGLAGGIAGAAAGALFGVVAMEGIQRPVIAGFVVAGAVIFLLIRRIPGVQTAPPGS